MKPEWFKNASESFKAKNPHLFGVGGLGAVKRESSADAALEQSPPAQQGGKSGVAIRVTIIVLRKRLCDDDNSQSGGTKALRDAIAETFGVDDGDTKQIRFEYGQCETRGRTGCIVKVDCVA